MNDYGDPTYVPDSDEDVGNTGIGSGRGDSDAPDDGLSQQQPLLQPRASSDKPPPSNEPESKRQRVEDEEQALYNCFMEVEECYMLSVELDVTSQRQKTTVCQTSKPLFGTKDARLRSQVDPPET